MNFDTERDFYWKNREKFARKNRPGRTSLKQFVLDRWFASDNPCTPDQGPFLRRIAASAKQSFFGLQRADGSAYRAVDSALNKGLSKLRDLVAGDQVVGNSKLAACIEPTEDLELVPWGS